MYCGKCGKEIADNIKFCPYCGAEQNVSQKRSPSQQQTNSSGNTEGKKKKNRKPIAIAVAAVAVVCIAVVLVIALRKPTISLNQYLTVEFDGAEGYGTASASIDYEEMLSDCRDKLKVADDTLFSSSDLLMFCVDGSLDKVDGLSNGDTVIFSWSCDDEEALDTFGIKLNYSDQEFTVDGLEEMETRNLFEDFEVTFSGISPEGEVVVNLINNNDYTSYLNYNLDKSEGLSNGDTITISLSVNSNIDINQFFAENYGFIPESTEKTYTVEGLESYVVSLADISGDVMEKMKAQGEDAFTSFVAQNWEEEATVDEISYCGNYLLVNKDPSTYDGAVNQLYLVYHVKSSLDYTTVTGDKNFKASPEFYWYICYENLIVGADGETIVDVNDYETVKDSFKVTADNIMSWGSPKSWGYNGYETLDDLEYAVVTTNREAYSSESNIEAVEPENTENASETTENTEESESTTEESSETLTETDTVVEETVSEETVY